MPAKSRSLARKNFPELQPNGSPVGKSQKNIEKALAELGIHLTFNSFSHRPFLEQEGLSVELDDAALMRIYFELDRLGLKIPKIWFIDCVINIARLSAFNPVLKSLDSLLWDGHERLDGWLVRHAGGDDTPFARAVFKLALIAAVRRIRRPGTKFDQIIVLEGPQGCGKSTFVQILAGGPEYFTDALPLGATEKETIEITAGKTTVEIGELRGASKRDLSAIKQFASRQADRARLSYGSLAVEIPRQFTIWGTTNDNEYLSDPTGNRRFWPLVVGNIDNAQARIDRAQLWAEAAHLESINHPIVLPEELWGQAAEAQQQRVSLDAWHDPIRKLLAPHSGQSVVVTSGDILTALCFSVDRHTKQVDMRVAACLRALDFQRITVGKENRRAWLRGDKLGAVRLRGTAGALVDGACYEL